MSTDSTAVDWCVFSNGMLTPSGFQQSTWETDARASFDEKVGQRLDRQQVALEKMATYSPVEPGVSAVRDVTRGDFHVPKIASSNPVGRVTFSPIQEWEGFVSEIGDEVFTGLLVDLTAKKTRPEEKMEFPISDLSEDDKSLLREGAIFRWSIGYQKQHGTKKRVSQIVFRRLPAWTRSDFEASKIKVKNILENVVWD
jgi:hypothetical protein